MGNIQKQDSLFMTGHFFGVQSELGQIYIGWVENIQIAGITTT
jgi:hypothetical protein